jgi:hypothetical protein
VPWARLRKDEHDNVIGVLAAAFKLRPDEPYLSATWAEFFARTTLDENVQHAVREIRNSSIQVRPRSGFAFGMVGPIKATCYQRPKKYRIRVIHEKEADNRAHTAMRGWPSDDDDLLGLLSEDVWSSYILNRDVPA